MMKSAYKGRNGCHGAEGIEFSWSEVTPTMHWTGVLNEGSAFEASAEYVDVDVSPQRVEFDEQCRQLKAVLMGMVRSAPSWDGEHTDVKMNSALTASRFVDSMPNNRKLPVVAPDGEGDILLVWENGNDDCIVTVEPNLLHMVVGANSLNAKHVDAVPFLGRHIHPKILQHIPAK